MAKKEVTTAENSAETTKETKQTKDVVAKPAKTKKVKTKKEKKGGSKLKGYVSELKKVTWPTFKEVVSRTGVVLAFVGIFVVVLLGMSLGLKPLFDLLTKLM